MLLQNPALGRKLEERALDVLASGDYERALSLIELRFGMSDPPMALVPSYVLCLWKIGRTQAAQHLAAQMAQALNVMPPSAHTLNLRRLLFSAAPMAASPRQASDVALFGGAS